MPCVDDEFVVAFDGSWNAVVNALIVGTGKLVASVVIFFEQL